MFRTSLAQYRLPLPRRPLRQPLLSPSIEAVEIKAASENCLDNMPRWQGWVEGSSKNIL